MRTVIPKRWWNRQEGLAPRNGVAHDGRDQAIRKCQSGSAAKTMKDLLELQPTLEINPDHEHQEAVRRPQRGQKHVGWHARPESILDSQAMHNDQVGRDPYDHLQLTRLG